MYKCKKCLDEKLKLLSFKTLYCEKMENGTRCGGVLELYDSLINF